MIIRVLNAIDEAMVLLSKVLLFGLLVMLFVSILGRATIQVSIPDQSIITEFLMVAIVFLALGHAQRRGKHLDVEVLSNLAGPVFRKVARWFALSLGILVIGGSTWFSAETAYRAFITDKVVFSSVLYLPEWPGRALVALGLGWWTVRMVLALIRPVEGANGEASTESI